MWGPRDERRFREVADGAEGGGGGADLREAEGGVVGQEVVDGDNVVDETCRRWRRRRVGDGACGERTLS